MSRGQDMRRFLRSAPLLAGLGLAGVTTALVMAVPAQTLPSAAGGSITDSPRR